MGCNTSFLLNAVAKSNSHAQEWEWGMYMKRFSKISFQNIQEGILIRKKKARILTDQITFAHVQLGQDISTFS